MPKIKIPVTDMNARVVEVPDHDHLRKHQASTDYFFWPIYKDKLGKVEPGTGLTVLINDYYALIDGYKVAYRGIKELKWDQKITLDVSSIVGLGDRYIVLRVGRDEKGRRESKEGSIVITDVAPNDYGVIEIDGETTIPFAKINIPDETTQVDETMIDNSVKKWLVDIDKAITNLKIYIDQRYTEIEADLISMKLDILLTLREEIAQGDQAVLDELNSKYSELRTDLDNVIQEQWRQNGDISWLIDQINNVIRPKLQNLEDYVNQQIASLESRTDELENWLVDLQIMVDNNEAWKQMIIDQLSELESDIVANQAAIQNNLERIETLENQNIVTVGKWEQINAINNAKNTFRISVIDRKVSGVLKNGFYDTFEDDSGIDTSNSANYTINEGHVTGTSNVPKETIGLWKMDTGYGNIAIDSSGNGFDGVLYGTSWVDGKFGKALKFFGPNVRSIIELGVLGNISQEITLATHIYPISYNFGKPHYMLICYNLGRISISLDSNGVPQLYFYNGSHFVPLVASSALPLNQWSSVIGVKSLVEGTKLYVNGVLVASDPSQTGQWHGDWRYESYIGGAYTSAQPYVNAILDEVAVIGKAFNDLEASNYHTYPLSNSGGVAAIVQSISYTASSSPDTAIIIAEDTGNVTYEVSRDGGTTWTAATKNVETDISSQPAGTSMVLKATIPAGEKIDNWALLWS